VRVAAKIHARTQSQEFDFARNNFDLIRLIAASEVALRHSIVHIAPECFPGWLQTVLALIPGVPIFYFLSGYLISRAWERSASPKDYFRNRSLRLFPALWICTALSLIAVFASGYMSTINWSPLKLSLWVICQGTVFQFWNPDFFRGFGVGVVNGSLGTVSIEIQFYCVIAVLHTIFRRLSPNQFTVVLGALTVGASGINVMSPQIAHELTAWWGSDVAGKLFQLSFLPWIFMFLLGAVAQRTSRFLVPNLLNHAWQTVVLYVAALLVDFYCWGLPLGNNIPFYLVPIMGAATLVCGYSWPNFAGQVLHRNDISYGLYIYHMPVANVFLYSGVLSGIAAVITSLAVSITLAMMSWKLIEKPFLRRKRNAIYPVTDVSMTVTASSIRSSH
jgi:peptidoglycan/LPS O-acetylase OafA/YrhL